MPNGNGKKPNKKECAPKKKPVLTPQQIAVIGAILTNALEIKSILIDTDQVVQIVLEGSLHKKTKMEKLISEMSDLTMGDFFDALSKR